jgi:hypothetical protein
VDRKACGSAPETSVELTQETANALVEVFLADYETRTLSNAGLPALAALTWSIYVACRLPLGLIIIFGGRCGTRGSSGILGGRGGPCLLMELLDAALRTP